MVKDQQNKQDRAGPDIDIKCEPEICIQRRIGRGAVKNRRDLADLVPLWNGREEPHTEAWLYPHHDSMTAFFKVYETEPRAEVQEDMGRVCTDSACELFLCLPDQDEAFVTEETHPELFYTDEDDERLMEIVMYGEIEVPFRPQAEHHIYINIEVNALGCVYAKYGRSRQNRTPFSEAMMKALEIDVENFEDHWEMQINVPYWVLNEIAGFKLMKPGCVFGWNLCKISETPEIEHYASYAQFERDEPNFHRPQDFPRMVML